MNCMLLSWGHNFTTRRQCSRQRGPGHRKALEAAVADAAPPEEDHPPPHLPHQKTNHLFLGSQCDCIVYYCDVYHTILFPDEIISVLQYLLSLIEDFLDDQIVQWMHWTYWTHWTFWLSRASSIRLSKFHPFLTIASRWNTLDFTQVICWAWLKMS